MKTKTYKIEFDLEIPVSDKHPFDTWLVQKFMDFVKLPQVVGWDMNEMLDDGTTRNIFQYVYDRHTKKDSEKI
jgi:hypothetical protein